MAYAWLEGAAGEATDRDALLTPTAWQKQSRRQASYGTQALAIRHQETRPMVSCLHASGIMCVAHSIPYHEVIFMSVRFNIHSYP
jgi:hypothetical protein